MSFSVRQVRRPVTFSIVGIIIGVYVTQLLAAGSITSTAAFSTIPKPPSLPYILLNPWMHSHHLHILQNLVAFLFLGWWLEPQIQSHKFAALILLTGYITNLVPAVIGFGGLGVGASGITHMLWPLLGLYQGNQFRRCYENKQIPDRAWIGNLVLCVLSLIVLGKTIGEYVGVLQPLSGTATGAHMAGVILGTAAIMPLFWRNKLPDRTENSTHDETEIPR